MSGLYYRIKQRAFIWFCVLALVIASAAPVFAQTDTPVPPTAVPSIEIPMDDIVTYLNQWIGVFAPIVLLIGMIPVAIMLLRFIANMFKSAFSGGGK